LVPPQIVLTLGTSVDVSNVAVHVALLFTYILGSVPLPNCAMVQTDDTGPAGKGLAVHIRLLLSGVQLVHDGVDVAVAQTEVLVCTSGSPLKPEPQYIVWVCGEVESGVHTHVLSVVVVNVGEVDSSVQDEVVVCVIKPVWPIGQEDVEICVEEVQLLLESTFTIAELVAMPPAPLQVMKKVVSSVMGPEDWEPLVETGLSF
jgi:hypothetical protein